MISRKKQMIKFLKERLGYGLAGFFVFLLTIAAVAKYFDGKMSNKYFWFVPLGFFLGLFLPKEIIGAIFLNTLKAGSTNPKTFEVANELDKPQKGLAVYIVYGIGVLLLFFLAYIVFITVFK